MNQFVDNAIGGYEDDHLVNVKTNEHSDAREAFTQSVANFQNANAWFACKHQDKPDMKVAGYFFRDGYQAAITHERKLADELAEALRKICSCEGIKNLKALRAINATSIRDVAYEALIKHQAARGM